MISLTELLIIFEKFENQLGLNMLQFPNFIGAKLLATEKEKNAGKVPEKIIINPFATAQLNMSVAVIDIFICSQPIFSPPSMNMKIAG